MAITVEDGSGIMGANSYVTAAFAQTYHDDRGNDWTQNDGALIKATDYVDREFRARLKGERVDVLQALEWPRRDVWINRDRHSGFDDLDLSTGYFARADYLYPNNRVPDEIKQAVCDVALAIASGESETEAVGPIKKQAVGSLSVEYFEPIKQRISDYGADVAETISRYLRPAGRLQRV